MTPLPKPARRGPKPRRPIRWRLAPLMATVVKSENGIHLTSDGTVFRVVPRAGSRHVTVIRGSMEPCLKCGTVYFRMRRNLKASPRPNAFCSKRCAILGRKQTAEHTQNSKRGKNRTYSERKVKTTTVDAVAGLLCRARGACQAAGVDGRPCGGPLQWAHIISRSYRRVRWDADNCLCLCRDHHMFYTHRPIEWEDFLLSLIGETRYRVLRARAIETGPKPDQREIYRALIAEAETRGLR